MFDTVNNALEFRQDYDGKYIYGKVVDNNDPLDLNRIKVSAPGLYDPDSGEVPWVGPMKVSPFGISKDWGVYGSPAKDSDVLILLQDGDPHYPVYFSFQMFGRKDFPPNTWGFVDPYGNKLQVDLKSGEITFAAKDGVTFYMQGGNLTVTTANTTTLKTKAAVVEAETVEVTAKTMKITADIDTYGALRNNDVDVGSNHAHTNVKPGSSNSGPPAR